MIRHPMLPLAVLLLAPAIAIASLKPVAPRQVVSLDGTWQIDEGSMDAPPARFAHTVPVPGLADMAQPAFADVGKKSPLRQAFWYRRTFRLDGPISETAILKIHKARYGTTVFLNGEPAGEHLPCFTPAYLDVRKLLKGPGEENELVIRVGANRESLPAGMPGGWDFEKYLYIPGIYDSVELILTGSPYIVNVQAVPDIATKRVKAVVEITAGGVWGTVALSGEVREAASGKIVASTQKAMPANVAASGRGTFSLEFPIENCHLWSPEDPFLYELQIRLGDSDAVKTRFGMRSFRFDPQAMRAVLNEKPYYMRGTNVTIYRFFEDALRGDKPWRAEWVRRLHQQYKSMHWNSIRYCIGFPPEQWYDMADEEGFLIQDEFPIWLGRTPVKVSEKVTAEKIIPEYTEWMRERWNHPCVVIWDGQNETIFGETGRAIQAVRHLDLSKRPWENGWSEPQAATDCVESHPYLFSRGTTGKRFFHLKELETTSGVPRLLDPQKKIRVPIIINEYCWLWLNRDGTTTCVTNKVYEGLLGKQSTTDQRRMAHARNVAALTEFWRGHREAAGVLHFCGLGYSRPGDKPKPEGGTTCDDFIDIEKLVFEPLFEQYVREAFDPVGLMLDFWAEEVAAGEQRPVKVNVINDLEPAWKGEVHLRVLRGSEQVSLQSKPLTVAGYDRAAVTFDVRFPTAPGAYTLVAEHSDAAGKPVRSLRDFQVK